MHGVARARIGSGPTSGENPQLRVGGMKFAGIVRPYQVNEAGVLPSVDPEDDAR